MELALPRGARNEGRADDERMVSGAPRDIYPQARKYENVQAKKTKYEKTGTSGEAPRAPHLTLAEARVADHQDVRVASSGHLTVPARTSEQAQDQPGLRDRGASGGDEDGRFREVCFVWNGEDKRHTPHCALLRQSRAKIYT